MQDGARQASACGPLIDTHAHIIPADPPIAGDAWIVPNYAFTAENLLAHMDAHGVQLAVISALSIAGNYSDYVIEALRQHKRLRGTVLASPALDRYTLDRMAADGIIGMRLQLARQTRVPDLGDENYRLLFRRLRDLNWHVHIAIEGPNLRRVLKPLLASGVNIVIDHFGHPDPADPLECDGFKAMFDAVDLGHTWIKLSGGYRLAGTAAWQEDSDGDLTEPARTIAAEVCRRVGPERLLWGSDAPFVGYEGRVSYESVLADYFSWVPDLQTRAKIDRTALKLLFS